MKQTIQLGTISAANISITFLFQWYILTQLGAGIETDALFAGMTLPQLVLAVVSGSLTHVLIPLLAGENENQLRHDAWAFLILVSGLFGSLAVILYVTASWWIPITVPGFSNTGQALTVDLTRIQLIGMVFSAINGVQWAAYHARQQFVWAEFTSILSSTLSLVLLIWALPIYGVTAAAWISTLRIALQTLLLTPGMGRPIKPNLKSAAIQQAWLRIKPLLLGTVYYKTDPLVDRFLLSSANSGSLSLYYLAQQIYSSASTVINKAISAPLVPLLSKLYKTRDRYGFRCTYLRKLWQIGGISIAGVLVIGLLGQIILNLLVGYGNITADNVNELWWIMIWLAGMFVGGLLGQICSSTFYAMGDTKTLVQVGIITYTIYIPSKIAAFYYHGIMGLAIVTSAYYMIELLLELFLIEKNSWESQ